MSELKADIEAEAAAQGYAVQYYNAGNDPETQLRQVHEALAEGVETLLVNLADGEDSEKEMCIRDRYYVEARKIK